MDAALCLLGNTNRGEPMKLSALASVITLVSGCASTSTQPKAVAPELIAPGHKAAHWGSRGARLTSLVFEGFKGEPPWAVLEMELHARVVPLGGQGSPFVRELQHR